MMRMALLSLSVLLIAVATTLGQDAQSSQRPEIETTYNQAKDVTTVKLPQSRISEERDRYRSLDYSIFYTYPGREKQIPSHVNFELVAIVKARKLNTDLYVVFVIDDERLHFSSNRAAILNPVPGRLWIGERMDFSIPYESFKKLAGAQHVTIKMGDTNFDLSEEVLASIRRLAATIQ